MTLFHAGTGIALKILRAPLRVHDLSQAVQLHPELPAGAVLVADWGLCSSAHLALLRQGGVHAVLHMHQKQSGDFNPGRPHLDPGQGRPKGITGLPRSWWVRQLGKQDQVLDWLKPVTCPTGMSPEQYAPLPESLEVRELRYHVHRKGFRVETVTVVTILVDAQQYRVEDLADLFLSRWGIETNLGHLTTTMGLDVPRGKTVNGGSKNSWSLR
jgi:hypothetical protein